MRHFTRTAVPICERSLFLDDEKNLFPGGVKVPMRSYTYNRMLQEIIEKFEER
jgi:hypothetical protein